jgi:hypothetical protein
VIGNLLVRLIELLVGTYHVNKHGQSTDACTAAYARFCSNRRKLRSGEARQRNQNRISIPFSISLAILPAT